MGAKLKQEDVIRRFKEVHSNFYDYSKTAYINKRTKVTIICPEHGEFQQLPNDHWRGRGCPKCGLYKGFNKGGYSFEFLDLHPELAEEDLYIYKLLLTGNGESFYKIGLSMNPSDRGRFRHYRYAGYEVKVLQILKTTFAKAIELEQLIKDSCKDRQHWPRERFAGFTECINIGG